MLLQSIWSHSCEIPARNQLQKDIQTDTAIIGAGLAGLLTAYRLREKGVETVVLEAGAVGSGQTKNTTAKITSQHGLIYDTLLNKFGEDKARQYAAANQTAVVEFRDMITKNQIDCDFEVQPAFVYSTSDEDSLKKEAKAAQVLGLPAHFTDNVRLPFPTAGAVCFAEQAQFHPLKFLKTLAEGMTIYENTRVLSVEDNCLRTENFRITAKHIVFATHYPFVNFPGYYFLRMHQERSYLLALENAPAVDGMYLSMDDNGYTLRNYKNLLLFGGANHRTGENTKGGKYDSLRAAAKKYFPGAKEVAHWSAQDCMPLDSIPYIGRFSESTPGWYVATGFKKWGMSSSMVAADILSDLICGQENPNAEVFSPHRFNTNSVPSAVTETVQAVKGLSRQIFSPGRAAVEQLPRGHGGIVTDSDGNKVGVYKDSSGKIYAVHPRCPHLGCQLEWNPDEKSWDCPCHGSRFDYHGNLIDNPAQANIASEEL